MMSLVHYLVNNVNYRMPVNSGISLKVSSAHLSGKWCCLHGEMQQWSDMCLSHHGAVFDSLFLSPDPRKGPSLKAI